MSNLTITAADVALVESIERFDAPAAEAVTAGQYGRLDTPTGKIALGNASSDAEARDGGIILKSAAAGMPTTLLRKGIVDLGAALDGLSFDADVYLSETDGTLADANPVEAEVQTLTFSGTPTGGTFAITVINPNTGISKTTTAIAYNASAATIQTALLALDNVEADDVRVTGTTLPDQVITLTWGGQFYGKNVAPVTVDVALSTGGTPACAVATSNAGVLKKVVGTVVPGWGNTSADRLLRVNL